MQTIHVPGLRDLGCRHGFGCTDAMADNDIVHTASNGHPYARERFAEAFGPVAGHLDLGNHTLVWIDSSSLLQ